MAWDQELSAQFSMGSFFIQSPYHCFFFQVIYQKITH